MTGPRAHDGECTYRDGGTLHPLNHAVKRTLTAGMMMGGSGWLWRVRCVWTIPSLKVQGWGMGTCPGLQVLWASCTRRGRRTPNGTASLSDFQSVPRLVSSSMVRTGPTLAWNGKNHTRPLPTRATDAWEPPYRHPITTHTHPYLSLVTGFSCIARAQLVSPS